MPINELGTGLEKIRERRRLSWEVIFVAALLALLINVFSTCLLNALDPSSANPQYWRKGVLLSGIALFLVVTIILVVKWRNENEDVGLTLLLPIYVDKQRQTSEILHHKHYAPARHARQFFAKAGDDFMIQFANAWPGPNPIKNAVFAPGHFCWDTIAQIVQALIILSLRKHGEMTLTESSRFHGEFRRIAGHIPSQTIGRGKWPAFLQRNVFLKGSGVEKVRVPKHVKVLSSDSRYTGKNAPAGLTLASRYGSLTFYVSPYWTVLSEPKAAIESFSPPDASKACFLAIPVELHLTLKGFYISREGMTYQYLWFQQLIENVRRRMSWGQHLRQRGPFVVDV